MFGKKRIRGGLNFNLFNKGRKYPILRDETGRSARRRTFDLFDLDYSVDEVFEEVGISRETARRYHYDWRKRGKGWDSRYLTIRHLMKTNPEISERVVGRLMEAFSMTEEEVVELLLQSSGLKRGLLGQWPNRYMEGVRSRVQARLCIALDIVAFHEMGGVALDEMWNALADLLAKARRRRRNSGG